MKGRNGSSILSAGPAWVQMLKSISRRYPFLSLPHHPSPVTDSTHVLQDIIKIHWPPLLVYQSVIEKTCSLAFCTQAMGAAMARPGRLQQGEIKVAFWRTTWLICCHYILHCPDLTLLGWGQLLPCPPFLRALYGPFFGFFVFKFILYIDENQNTEQSRKSITTGAYKYIGVGKVQHCHTATVRKNTNTLLLSRDGGGEYKDKIAYVTS